MVRAASSATCMAVSEFSCVGRAVDPVQAIARMKRSPKRMANCALAMHHSRAGMVHSFSDRFKTKNNTPCSETCRYNRRPLSVLARSPASPCLSNTAQNTPGGSRWNRNRPRFAVFARSRGLPRRRSSRGAEKPASRGAKRAGRILASACTRVVAGVSRRPAMRGRGSASVSLPGALSVLHQHGKGCSVRDLKLLIRFPAD